MTPASDTATDRVSATDDPGRRGSNQAGMRAHNERLVLSLVRRHGALAKSDIARITGLSAQTVSVIMRALESDGLLGVVIRYGVASGSLRCRCIWRLTARIFWG